MTRTCIQWTGKLKLPTQINNRPIYCQLTNINLLLWHRQQTFNQALQMLTPKITMVPLWVEAQFYKRHSYPVIPRSCSSPTSHYCTDAFEKDLGNPTPLGRSLQPHLWRSPTPEMKWNNLISSHTHLIHSVPSTRGSQIHLQMYRMFPPGLWYFSDHSV